VHTTVSSEAEIKLCG